MADSICFFGAGASVPFGIPTMAEMVRGLEAKIANDYTIAPLFNEIEIKLKDYESFDIEALITVLEDIIGKEPTAVLRHPSVHYFSIWDHGFPTMTRQAAQTADRNKDSAEKLLREVKLFVAESCTIKDYRFEILETFFPVVLLNRGYDLQVDMSQVHPTGLNYQIFTTNYDPVIEAFFYAKRLPYECGQMPDLSLDISRSGNSSLYGTDSKMFQIYKLHGSINWYRADDGRLRWGTEPAQSGSQTLLGDEILSELLIYPTQDKYTFREPFYSMFHQLKERLQQSEVCYPGFPRSTCIA